MKRMKTFLIYILCILGFMVISEFLITVGLNSKYESIERIDDNEQIIIYQADANSVAGRIKGIVTNSEDDISGKYIKLDFYTERNVCIGTKYIQIESLSSEQSQAFEVYFNLQDIDYYEASIVDEKEDVYDDAFFDEEYSNVKVLKWIIVAMLIW